MSSKPLEQETESADATGSAVACDAENPNASAGDPNDDFFEAVVCVAVDGIDDVAEVAEHMLTWGWVLTDCVQESAHMDLDFSRWFPVEVPLEVMQKDGKRAVMAIGRLSGPLHVGAPS